MTTRCPRRPPPLTTAELAAGLQAGEADAAAALYRDYGRLVYVVAHRRLGRADLAEEATQETMLRVWRSADRIDRDRSIVPWLTTIAQRVAIDIGRREQRRATVPLREEAEPAEGPDEMARSETAMVVERALDRLGAPAAELARLHHWDGYTYTEVAARIDIPVGTVKSRCHRMHHQLHELLADCV